MALIYGDFKMANFKKAYKLNIMKTRYSTIIFGIFLGCTAPENKQQSEEEILIQERDSLQFVFDSLMQINVAIPQEFDYSIFNSDCIETFNKLARETGGEMKVVANSNLVAKTILEIVQKYAVNNSDIMIILDKTQSMQDDLDDIKKSLHLIIEKLMSYKNIRLAMALYGDKNVDGNEWYDYQNFEGDYFATNSFVDKIEVTGGGDYPESVYDGIFEAFQEGFWQSGSKRIVILLGDAPSLDSSLTTHTSKEIIEIATKDEINMNFYPVVLNPNPILDDIPRMASIKLIDNVYPNPSSGLISISLTTDQPLTLEIFDESGKLLSTELISGEIIRKDLTGLQNGLYVIRTTDQYKNYDTEKLIISK